MLPQKSQILAVMMATLLSLGSLSLMPLDVYASHSYEAGVQGDAIPDNTHIDLSQLTLPSTGAFPLYDSSPNFVSGHFLYRAPCETESKEPLVSVIAGHIDEARNLTHVDFVPLYYIGHASTADSCVYHAHLPDPLEGGSPRVTDVDLVNYSPNNVTFNAGDAVDINIQRSLGNIGEYYAGDEKLPLDLTGNNPVLTLNDDIGEAAANNVNVQQTLSDLVQLNADYMKSPFELAGGNNQLLNMMNEENDNDNNDDNNNNNDNEDENDNDEEEDQEEE